MKQFPKPQSGEYAPYVSMYIDLLPDDECILDHLQANFEMLKALVADLPEEKLITPCAEGEWTIKEILVHNIDDERIYSYRALRFARNDMTELPGFEQDDYTRYSGANGRSIEDVLAEYEAVRQATIWLFNNLDDEALVRAGVSNGHRMSVRAAAYHMAGHELHHIHSIQANYLTD